MLEDSAAAETDMNVVMTEDGRIIEGLVVPRKAREPFSHEELHFVGAGPEGGI